MNNVFLLLFWISFLCIPIFIIWALINLIRKKPAKKRFIFSGISALTLIISTVGFGLTMDGDNSPNEAIGVASESPATMADSPTLQPTITPTIIPTIIPTVQPTVTPIPTKAPTPKPTQMPTAQPTVSPTSRPTEATTPQPTVAPTPRPTETPQQVLQPTEAPATQVESTPELQIVAEPTSQPAAVPDSQPVVASSGGNSGSSSGENGISTYGNMASQNTDSTMVWIDDTAKRYHRKNGCGMDNAYQVTLEEAIQKGKTPCGRCYK